MPRSREASALVDQYLKCHGACDLEGVLSLFAPDARVEDPVGSEPHVGMESIRGFYRAVQARNGVLSLERLGDVLACGDEIAAHVRASAPGGTARSMEVIYTLRVDEANQIVSLRAFF